MMLMGAQSLITAEQAEHSAYLSSPGTSGVSIFRRAKGLGGHWAVPGHGRIVSVVTLTCATYAP